MFIKRLHHCIGGLALGLAFVSACGRGVCDGKSAGCIALQVDGNDKVEPVYVEILDAFGHQLDLRHTNPQPQNLVEVPIEGGYDPSAARCLRVWVGSGQERKTALVKVSNWSAGGTPVLVPLQTRPKVARFNPDPLHAEIQGGGSSVAIGRVPGAPGGLPMLLVGSFDQARILGAVEFFHVESDSSLTPNPMFKLPYGTPPYPLALSGNSDKTAMLVVGTDPRPTGGWVITQPSVFEPSAVGGFTPNSIMIPFADGDANAQTTFVAATFLDGDSATEVVTNWQNKAAKTCGTAIYRGPDFKQRGSSIAPIVSAMCLDLSALTLADLDNDERPDVLRSIDGTVTASLSMADGSFARPMLVVPEQTPPMTLLGLTTGDLNGDRMRDLVVAVNSDLSGGIGGTSVITSLGPLVPNAPKSNPITLGPSFPRATVAVDINGDFLDDIVVASFGTNTGGPIVGIWGASQNLGADNIITVPQKEPNLYDIAAGDLNGDCLPDLAVVAFQSKMVFVFLNESPTVQQP